jgi:Amt family ammonium transporter
VFASAAYNEGGADGLIAGSSALFIANLKATVVGCLYAAAVTFVILRILQKAIGLRVDEEVEIEGLDQHLHGEKGYSDVGTTQLGEG